MNDARAIDKPDPRDLPHSWGGDDWHTLDMSTSPPTIVRFKSDEADVVRALQYMQIATGVSIDCLAQWDASGTDGDQTYSAWFSDKVDGLILADTIQPVGIFERKDG